MAFSLSVALSGFQKPVSCYSCPVSSSPSSLSPLPPPFFFSPFVCFLRVDVCVCGVASCSRIYTGGGHHAGHLLPSGQTLTLHLYTIPILPSILVRVSACQFADGYGCGYGAWVQVWAVFLGGPCTFVFRICQRR